MINLHHWRLAAGTLAATVVLTAGAVHVGAEVGMTPKILIPGAGTFHCTVPPALLATRRAMSDDHAAIRPLADLLARKFASPVEPQPAGRSLGGSAYILAGLSTERADLKA